MQSIKNREELYEYYTKSSKQDWQKYIQSLTVPHYAVTKPLYHMSFKDDAEGLWTPRPPNHESPNKTPHPLYGEMLPDRISASSTIEGCWYGVSAWLINELKLPKNKRLEIVAYIYRVIPKRGCRILTDDVLANSYLVHDAHFTNEYCLLGDCDMVLETKLTIRNTYFDKKWVHTYPFNSKEYKDINFPPLDILTNELIQKESPMLEFSSNSNPDFIKSQLSLEAMSNPLSMLSEGLVNRFSNLLNILGKADTELTVVGAERVPHSHLTKRQVKTIVSKNNYMDLQHYGVAVPSGFIGPLLPYMQLLETTLTVFKNIRADITKPVLAEIGVILANPDRLRSATISPLSRINFHDKTRTDFQKKVQSYYSTESSRDQLAFSRCFNDNGEFIAAASAADDLVHLLKKVNSDVKDVLSDVKDISDLTDKLSVRLLQDREVYGVNATVANDIAVVVTRTAESVSFLAALIAMAEETIGVLDNLALKIN